MDDLRSDKCPKCDWPIDAGLNESSRWILRYCPGFKFGTCLHNQVSEHLFRQCFCGAEFDIQPCADAKQKKAAA